MSFTYIIRAQKQRSTLSRFWILAGSGGRTPAVVGTRRWGGVFFCRKSASAPSLTQMPRQVLGTHRETTESSGIPRGRFGAELPEVSCALNPGEPGRAHLCAASRGPHCGIQEDKGREAEASATRNPAFKDLNSSLLCTSLPASPRPSPTEHA